MISRQEFIRTITFMALFAGATGAQAKKKKKKPPLIDPNKQYVDQKAMRRISAGGGSMSHTWVSTAIEVREGDIVVIEPSGRWSFPGQTGVCGPAGYPIKITSYTRHRNMRYGALLFRIGREGSVQAVGGAKRIFKAGRNGHLYLDSNVTDDRAIVRHIAI